MWPKKEVRHTSKIRDDLDILLLKIESSRIEISPYFYDFEFLQEKKIGLDEPYVWYYSFQAIN